MLPIISISVNTVRMTAVMLDISLFSGIIAQAGARLTWSSCQLLCWCCARLVITIIIMLLFFMMSLKIKLGLDLTACSLRFLSYLHKKPLPCS